jgi:hypothetical protein
LADLAKTKTNLPNWIKENGSYKLSGWNGNDYIILCENDNYIIKKKKSSSKEYRQDKSIKGKSAEEVFNKLKIKIKLP